MSKWKIEIDNDLCTVWMPNGYTLSIYREHQELDLFLKMRALKEAQSIYTKILEFQVVDGFKQRKLFNESSE